MSIVGLRKARARRGPVSRDRPGGRPETPGKAPDLAAVLPRAMPGACPPMCQATGNATARTAKSLHADGDSPDTTRTIRPDPRTWGGAVSPADAVAPIAGAKDGVRFHLPHNRHAKTGPGLPRPTWCARWRFSAPGTRGGRGGLGRRAGLRGQDRGRSGTRQIAAGNRPGIGVRDG